ncbi:MAG: LuxR C-terminal-related transcriptional regulator [Chloroflexota bacterium]
MLQSSPVELLEYVIQVSQQMARIHRPKDLYTYVIDEVISFVGAEVGHLVALGNSGELEFEASRVQVDREKYLTIEQEDIISRSILETVIREKSPLVLGNALLDPRFSQAKSVVSQKLRSVMCVPLINQEAVIGAIYVENRKIESRFRKDDIGPLTLFANQAAVSIENARLYDSLEERVAERTNELDNLNQKMVLLMGQLVEAKNAAEGANEVLEDRVAERTEQLEQEVARTKAYEAEKEHLFKTMTQQSEQLRSITQLFLENQSRQQGITLTLQDQIQQKLELLQNIVDLMREIINHQEGNNPEATVMINHLSQAQSILDSLQEQTETVTTAIDQATAESRHLGQNPLINLSSREREVLNYLVVGKSRSEIAELLVISPGTVSTYRNRIFQKLEVDDNAGLMKLALEYNLFE